MLWRALVAASAVVLLGCGPSFSSAWLERRSLPHAVNATSLQPLWRCEDPDDGRICRALAQTPDRVGEQCEAWTEAEETAFNGHRCLAFRALWMASSRDFGTLRGGGAPPAPVAPDPLRVFVEERRLLLAQARDHLTQALAFTAEPMALREHRIQIILELGDRVGLLQEIEEVARLASDEVLWRLHKVGYHQLAQEDKFSFAEAIFSAILRGAPKHAPTLTDLGTLRLLDGDLEAAREAFDAVLGGEPADRFAAAGRAQVFLFSGRLDLATELAVEVYRRPSPGAEIAAASLIGPLALVASARAAELLTTARGADADALSAYLTALEALSEAPAEDWAQASVGLLEASPVLALTLALAAQQRAPTEASPVIAQGRALLYFGLLDARAQAFARYLLRLEAASGLDSVRLEEATLLLASAQLDAGQPARALQTLSRTEEGAPQLYFRGQALLDLGRTEDAREAWSRASESSGHWGALAKEALETILAPHDDGL